MHRSEKKPLSARTGVSSRFESVLANTAPAARNALDAASSHLMSRQSLSRPRIDDMIGDKFVELFQRRGDNVVCVMCPFTLCGKRLPIADRPHG